MCCYRNAKLTIGLPRKLRIWLRMGWTAEQAISAPLTFQSLDCSVRLQFLSFPDQDKLPAGGQCLWTGPYHQQPCNPRPRTLPSLVPASCRDAGFAVYLPGQRWHGITLHENWKASTSAIGVVCFDQAIICSTSPSNLQCTIHLESPYPQPVRVLCSMAWHAHLPTLVRDARGRTAAGIWIFRSPQFCSRAS